MKHFVAACALMWLLIGAQADFTFIHCSDIHIGAGDNAKTDAAMFEEIAKLDPKPAFIVNTGDVCESGTDAQYELYQKTMKSLGDVKAYVAPGNHDVRWNPRGKEGFTRGVEGKLYQSWDYENVHFVTLDSTVLLEHWGHISQEQLDWLKEDLAKVGNEKPIIIGFHHWIGRETVQVDNEQELLRLVEPYNVVLWLQGHGHADIDWRVNGTPATMVKGLYQGSYNVITVSKDELKISKRFIPDPKKKGDLIRDKTVPDEQIPPATKPLMTVPLTRANNPDWSATAKLQEKTIELSVNPPEGATLSYRINDGKPTAFAPQIPADNLVAGQHIITVQATLPDKRAYQIPITITIPGSVSPTWETNISGAVQSRLVKDADTLYVSSMGNDLVALNAIDGKEKWRFKTDGPVFSASCVSEGAVYFGSADHFVYALNAIDGSLKWKSKTDSAVLAGPGVAQSVVCVASTDTKIYGFNTTDGSIAWTVQGANMFQSQTATDGNTFFVGGWDNHFRAIDAKTGALVWDIELGRKTAAKNFSPFAPAITSPSVGDGKVFISTNDGILHGLNTIDGKVLWQIDWKKMGYSSPLYHNGKVYCALSDEGKTFRADATTGKIEWTCETNAVIYDSSFCIGGEAGKEQVFIGNVNGTLNAINAQTGNLTWQYRIGPGHLLGSPVADKASVWVGSMSGKVIALPCKSGSYNEFFDIGITRRRSRFSLLPTIRREENAPVICVLCFDASYYRSGVCRSDQPHAQQG